MKAAIRACESAGLRYDPNHTHPRVVDPKSNRFVSFSGSPSCPHAHKHLLKDVWKYLHIKVTV
jgi:hypothetical protein